MTMLQEKDVIQMLDDAKKELDRVTENRTKELGNSINYIENELQIVNLKGQITAYQEILNADPDNTPE